MLDFNFPNALKQGQHSNRDLIGLYVSRHLWSDVNVVGVVTGVFGKTGIIIQPMEAKKNFKPEFIAGGFSAHCTNQSAQEWTFDVLKEDDPIRLRVNKSFFRHKFMRFHREPYHYYDFNF